MNNKKIFLLLILSGSLFSNTFGPSEITVKKTWTFEGEEGTEFDLDALFVVNNSYQKVLKITKDPGLEVFYEGDGQVLKIHYNGTLDSTKKVLTASAVVKVAYNKKITKDYPLDPNPIKGDGYTAYDLGMSSKARQLSDSESTLRTIGNLVEWIHNYVDYDIDYFGNNVPAQTVYKDKKGVCVEYSHLLIALSKSLGLKTRYVSGLVKGEDWQPHAWVEIYLPEEGWLPAEPTFEELQNLDNTHIAVFYAEDQSEVVDRVNSVKEIKFSSKEEVVPIIMEKSDAPPVDFSYNFDEKSMQLIVDLENPKNEYVFFTYIVSFPEDVGGGDETILLLAPKEKKIFTYKLNGGHFKEGFVYNVPVLIAVNDHELNPELVITMQKKEPELPEIKEPADL
ncbi:transglutaminase domain-containing protein, partial [Candidatus Micrarchaeota archaeon]|nr:transglutaminase domain-containing protein [Candidatus Micrarchaeota archaeon]